MKLSVLQILFFIATCSSVAAQRLNKIPNDYHQKVKLFYQVNLTVDPKNIDACVKNSFLRPVALTSQNRKKQQGLYGIYGLIPPIDPKVEFILIKTDSVILIDPKSLNNDFNLYTEVIKKYGLLKNRDEWISFMEKLSSIYADRNPRKGSFLPQ